MAQKTLVLGIGTTGLQVCEDVLQRVVDEYGDLNRIPWIKAVAFETARASDPLSVMHGKVHDIGVSQENWQQLKTAPNTYQDSIGFLDWSDPDVIGLSNGTTQGAGNTRMIGRASWMFPTSMGIFDGEVRKALNELVPLSAERAKEARGTLPYENSNPDVVFEGVQANKQDAIVVYVCGTLTGGTCSGAFVDIGYYLQTLAGFQIDAVIGLFGMPHPAFDVDILCANAYAALTELNHFHRRNQTYEAKFQTRSAPTTRTGVPPYTSVFLCQPRGPAQGAQGEITKSFGQFIYLAALGEIGGELRADLINPATALAGTPDNYGNPMDFSSLGVSVIEYPAEHIIKACSYRLAAAAVEKWRSTQGVEQGPAMLVLTADPTRTNNPGPFLQKDQIFNELRKEADRADPFDLIIQHQVEAAAGHAGLGDFAAVAAAEANLEAGFKHDINQAYAITPGLFIDRIRQNADALVPERAARVRQLLRDRMLDSESGPNYCRDMGKHLAAYCSSWRDSLAGAQEAVSQQRMLMDEALERARDAHSSHSLAFGWRKTAAQMCANEYRQAALEYWRARLRAACVPHIRQLCEQLIELGQLTERRVTDSLYGFASWAAALGATLQQKDHEKSASTPEVNGQLLYRPNAEVDIAYRDCLKDCKHDGTKGINPSYQGEPFAQMKVLSGWTWIGYQIGAKPGNSFFDEPLVADALGKPKPVRPEDCDGVVNLARAFFRELLTVNAVDKLFQQPDPGRIIDDAKSKAEVFLKIDDAENPLVKNLAPAGTIWIPRLAFFRGASTAAGGSNGGKLKALLASSFPRQQELLEPHRVALLEARSVFSLRMVAGLNPKGQDNLRARFCHQEELHQRTFFSRSPKKIRWRPLEGPIEIPNRGMLMAGVLVGLAARRITGAAYSPLRFDFKPLGPGEKGGPIDLSHDLEEAAYELSRNQSARFSLEKAIKEEQASPIDLADKLLPFIDQVPQYALTVAGDPIGPKETRNLLLPYIRSVPGLWKAMMSGFPDAPTIDRLLVKGDPKRPDGYYCYACPAFLAALNQPDEIKDSCPGCGVPLKINFDAK